MNSIQKCAIAVGTEKIEFLMQSGFSEEGAKRSVSSHLHPNVEIHYISEGSFVFVTSKGERTVEKYTLVIIPPKHYHSFKACCPRVRRLSFEIRLSPDSRYASLFSSLTEPLAVNERISELDNVSDMMGVISGEEAICRINALFALSFLSRGLKPQLSRSLLNFMGPQCTGQQCPTYYSTKGDSVREFCLDVQIQEMQARG